MLQKYPLVGERRDSIDKRGDGHRSRSENDVTDTVDHEVDVRDGRPPKARRIQEPHRVREEEHVPTDVIVTDDLPPLDTSVLLTALDEGPDQYWGAAIRTGYTLPTFATGLAAVAVIGLRTELGLSPSDAAWFSLALGGAAFLIFTTGNIFHLILRARWARPSGRTTTPEHDAFTPQAPHSDFDRRIHAIEDTIEQFQRQAVRESSGSFRDSRTAMAIALLILTIGAASVIVAPDRSGQLVIGGLTALGSGFSAFLGKTFLDARNRALGQLNRAHAIYMAQLHSHFAFQMASATEEVQRTKLVEEIVRNTVAGVELILSGFLSPKPGPTAAPEHPTRISPKDKRG